MGVKVGWRGEMDVDGIGEDGTAEAIMRGGEWAFEV
jgi:leucyl aminopeptidase (aminopeptidase T)